MTRTANVLNDVEQLILLAVVRLGDGAYGVPIREEIERRAGRAVSMAAVYAGLDRLERRHLLASSLSEPVSERGGRARKHFLVSERGQEALAEARAMMNRMWDGVEVESSR